VRSAIAAVVSIVAIGLYLAIAGVLALGPSAIAAGTAAIGVTGALVAVAVAPSHGRRATGS
jgi:hypothetical protein